jgi:hypothetical protein
MVRYFGNYKNVRNILQLAVFIIQLYTAVASISIFTLDDLVEINTLESNKDQVKEVTLEGYSSEAKDHLVSNLPGFGTPKSNTFAGFATHLSILLFIILPRAKLADVCDKHCPAYWPMLKAKLDSKVLNVVGTLRLDGTISGTPKKRFITCRSYCFDI